MRSIDETWSSRTTGLAGIEGKLAKVSKLERISIFNSLIPTGFEIKEARRLASKTRASSACQPCMEMKKKCSDIRPCSRCIKSGKAEICSLESNASAFRRIQRPIDFRTTVVSLGPQASKPTVTLKNEWAYDSVIRLWTLGYSTESISKVFDTIPPQISTVMKRLLNIIQQISRLNMKCLTSDNAAAVKGDDMDFYPQMLATASCWEGDNVYGFFQVAFDPETRQRSAVVMNSRYAELLGFHKEELLARYANHDVALHRTEQDSLLIWLADQQHVFDDRVKGELEQYYRILGPAGGGGPRRALLVWTSVTKSFDALGRLVKITVMMQSIGPDDYDEAVRRWPASCPLHAMGDLRGGRQLLSDAVGDSWATLATMPHSPEGQRLIARLTTSIAAYTQTTEASLAAALHHSSAYLHPFPAAAAEPLPPAIPLFAAQAVPGPLAAAAFSMPPPPAAAVVAAAQPFVPATRAMAAMAGAALPPPEASSMAAAPPRFPH